MIVYEETIEELLGKEKKIKGIIPIGIRSGRIDFLPGLIRCEELPDVITAYNQDASVMKRPEAFLEYTVNEIGEPIFYYCCDEAKKRFDEVQVLLVTESNVVPFVLTITSEGTFLFFKVAGRPMEYNEWLDAVADYGQMEVARFSGFCFEGCTNLESKLEEMENIFGMLCDEIEQSWLLFQRLSCYAMPLISSMRMKERFAGDQCMEDEIPFFEYLNQPAVESLSR